MSGMLKVLSSGLGMTVQDYGRSGWLRYGLSESGAMDKIALAEGAALLGDDPTSAVIEMFMIGGKFEAEGRSLRIALTGAPMQTKINGTPAAWNSSYLLEEGDRLEIGKAVAGIYGYLRVGGGINTPPQLRSRATHLRAGIGGFMGRQLKAGDRITIGDDPGGPVGKTITAIERIGGSTVRAMWGAQSHMFEQAERQRFQNTSFRITTKIDRMGICLTSDADPIRAMDHLSVVSDAVVHGDVQISGDGRPVVLMADRPTTGGYPRIGNVIIADLSRMAQFAPGQEIFFKIISEGEAVNVLVKQAEDIQFINKRIS